MFLLLFFFSHLFEHVDQLGSSLQQVCLDPVPYSFLLSSGNSGAQNKCHLLPPPFIKQHGPVEGLLMASASASYKNCLCSEAPVYTYQNMKMKGRSSIGSQR